MIRQPIVSLLGHIDSGKTTILDYIRGTYVADKEAGQITQAIGATSIPIEKIKSVCGNLIDQMGYEIKIPGLLFIDTPGHGAFTSLKQRGSSLSDIAVLVIDVTEGVQPETKEALKILKKYETPFIIALNKIDKITGWQTINKCFSRNLEQQGKSVREDLNEKIYSIMGDLHEEGVTAERFDKIDNFQKKVGMVPMSAETGEGMPELMMLLSGLSQQFLKGNLKVEKGPGKETVLEVSELKGLGTTIEIVLYDGIIKKSDKLIVGEETIVSQIKAILRPKSLSETKSSGDFERVDEVRPAACVRIVAKDLEGVITGAPLRTIREGEEVEEHKEEIEKEMELSDFKTKKEGVVVKADSLGSLEAVLNMFEEENIPVKKEGVGKIKKSDIIEVENEEKENRVVFGFNTSLSRAGKALKDSKKVKVFTDNVIYKLTENYKEWKEELERKRREKALKDTIRPAKYRIMPEHTFRNSKPAIVGVEVMQGTLKPGSYVLTPEGEKLGRIKSVQSGGESVEEARKGKEVAISITNVTVGRQIEEGDTLYTDIKAKDYQRLNELEDMIPDDEKEVLEEIVEIKDKINPRWKLR